MSRFCLCCALFSVVCCFSAFGQGIKGVILDERGVPLPAATIFVKQNLSGTVANETGEYLLPLPPGVYHVVFQALGFQSEELTVKVADRMEEHRVTLRPQPIQLKEVRVYSGREDAAYAIMRKAIANAPLQLNSVKSYRSEIYIRGTTQLKKIPLLLAKQMKVNGASVKSRDVFSVESVNEIQFDAPDKYTHRVKQMRSALPREMGDNDQYLGYINNSFYQPQIGTAISPLAPSAFSHYRFVYEGYFEQQGYVVNQIRVIPKRKSQQLFEGTIFVVDQLWNLHSVNLTNTAFYGTLEIRQTYAPVKENLWLPVNHHYRMAVSMLGVKADASYVGAVKYLEVEEVAVPSSHNLQASANAGQPDLDRKRSGQQAKLETLLSKEELSNRDMMQAVRLMEKQNRSADTLQSLEVKERYQFLPSADSLRTPDAEWEQIRPVPLSKTELTGFQVSDSLRKMSALAKTDSVAAKRSGSNSLAGLVLGGKTWKMRGDSVQMSYKGLIDWTMWSFHPATGFEVGQRLNASWTIDRLNKLEIQNEITYAFALGKLNWSTRWQWKYEGNSPGDVVVTAWSQTMDYKHEMGDNAQLNGLYNLLLKDNYRSLVGVDQLALDWHQQLRHGLYLTLGSSWQQFRPLENHTNFSFFRTHSSYAPNRPIQIQAHDANFESATQVAMELGLTFIPYLRYKIVQGKKVSLDSRYPTFSLLLKKGISGAGNFTNLQLSISQNHRWGMFYALNWQVEAGKFWQSDNLNFYHWKHFGGSAAPVVVGSLNSQFHFWSPYAYSSREGYLRLSASYATPLLVLKYLPWVSNRLWLENIWVNHLFLPEKRSFTEIGYGLSQIFMVAKAGVFLGIEHEKQIRWGFRVGIGF